MTSITLPVQQTPPSKPSTPTTGTPRVALIGIPNTGKTLLFNALTGLRAKTANFSGTTVDHRVGRSTVAGRSVELIDLPGLYALDAISLEERVAEAVLRGESPDVPKPDAVLVVIDATNLERGLFLASQVISLQQPTMVALTMVDLARRNNVKIDVDQLKQELGCPVVPVAARTGEGLAELREQLAGLLYTGELPTVPEEQAACGSCTGCAYAARYDWAERVASRTGSSPLQSHGRKTEAIDRFLTHPVVGVVGFLGIMLGIFYLIFALAGYPMDWIEGAFGALGGWVSALLPDGEAYTWPWRIGVALAATAITVGIVRLAELKRWKLWLGVGAAIGVAAAMLPAEDLHSLAVDGIIGGVGGVLVFLPQILILFFLITLLEDSGYLARAAFVMDRLMRRVGLPGKAFVPMLSAHACAIPAIMSARVIDNWRDRMATIMVLPLLTCSARLPVYVMITALLFPEAPLLAALIFTGAYLLGILAAIGSAFVFKRTLLKGETQSLIIDLPSYKLPSLRSALLQTFDRGMLFVRKAGTIILLISIGLWAMLSYPKHDPAQDEALQQQVAAVESQAAAAEAAGDVEQAESLRAEAEVLTNGAALEHSLAGRVGKAVQPVFDPLGYTWEINVGVIASFAAREVIVATLGIVYGIGEEAAEDTGTLVGTLQAQTQPDGAPVFDLATSLSLLVFFVLAMQCLPTQAVTRRETGKWSWALLQLGYMTVLAWTAAFITYQVVSLATSA